jgi:hypothetical protein
MRIFPLFYPELFGVHPVLTASGWQAPLITVSTALRLDPQASGFYSPPPRRQNSAAHFFIFSRM